MTTEKIKNLGIELDDKAIEDEYLLRKQDMFDKYYGSREKKIEYRVRLLRFKKAIEEKEFSYLDEEGNLQTGIYKTLKSYSGMERDKSFLQLEEYAERLERMTKERAGDRFIYTNLPEGTKEEDKHYIETNNSSFNSHYYTQKDLKTLGKYGEKSQYLKLQEKQPLRNILRGALNVPVFLRNHITAPINKFIGSVIVAPIHRLVYPKEEAISNSTPYGNNRNHRYVARRDYFKDQGNGYFKSRYNALFKREEGDEAVLRAGASDIKSSIKDKYMYEVEKRLQVERIPQDVMALDEQIRELNDQLSHSANRDEKLELQSQLQSKTEEVNKLIKLYNGLEKDNGIQVAQTDAISDEQHAIASKEANTRKITGVKIIAKGLAVRYVGPRIKNWLLEHTQKEITTTIPAEDVVKNELVWIDPVTKKVDGISADNLRKVTVGDLLQGERTVDYAVGLGRKKEAVADLIYSRGVAIKDGAKVISATDGNGFNIGGISNIQLDQSLLDTSGNLDKSAPIFDVIASIKNSVQGTNITADEIVNQIASLGTIQEQTEALKTYFGNISIAESVNSAGIFSGWNDKSAEIINIINNGNLKTTVESIVKEGYWDTVEKTIKGTPQIIKEQVDNERVVNVLKTLGIVVEGGAVVGAIDDIYENIRTTKTGVKNNKGNKRNYDFNDGYSFKRGEIKTEEER